MLNRLCVSVAVMLLFFFWSVFLWKMELGSSGGLHLTKSSQCWRTWIDNTSVFKMVIEVLNLFLVYATINTATYLIQNSRHWEGFSTTLWVFSMLTKEQQR